MTYYCILKRTLDIIFCLVCIALFVLPAIVITILIKISSPGPAIYWSKRIGQSNKTFLMPKFRSMNINTPQVATHLLSDSNQHVTSIGKLLRKSSLDELPQIYSVLIGDMSFVGPRPALFNQHDLIELRTSKGIDQLKPGITGWAQINGRDSISIEKKVQLDHYYLEQKSTLLDFKVLMLTVLKVFKSDEILH